MMIWVKIRRGARSASAPGRGGRRLRGIDLLDGRIVS
jgi:hypothetical protein